MIDGFTDEQEPMSAVPADSIGIGTLLERYKKPESDGWLINFHELPEDMTGYNVSGIFEVVDGEIRIPHMLVRVEGKGADQEFTSKLAIYRCSENGRECWPTEISNLPGLIEGKIAQDPAISYVKDNWVVTWVEVEPHDRADPTKGSDFKTITAIGGTLDKLVRLFETESGTKGLRYVELIDGRIGLTSKTSKDGVNKMCFKIFDSWEDITAETLASAKEIKGLEGLVVNDVDEKKRRWIGPNGLQLLANGDLSLLFHAARFVENGIVGNREYDVAHCVLTPGPGDDPAQARYPKIIARAKDFNISVEVLPPKRPDLEFVSYPSWLGMAALSGDEAILLAALRDAGEVGQKVPDPLVHWRTDHPEFANNPFPQSTGRLALAA